ncbi:Cytochrome P478 monooxygenase [Paramyrothecium foliicola]|nr:Cytochrome P478 monooxygenase [Paramyrothecium foliicola]
MATPTSSFPVLWLPYVPVLSVIWGLYVATYRLFFHPLAKIPGPYLWAISGLPLLYHQGIKEGNLVYELPRLHGIYGPIVRIGPNEVHISEPADYDKIYHVGSKFLKDPNYYRPLEGPVRAPVLFTMLDPEAHRVRRNAVSPFFSRRSVNELEGLIWGKVHKLCNIIQSHLDSQPTKQFDAYGAFRAYSVDVVTEYSYARSWNHLDEKGFGSWFPDSLRNVQLLFIWCQTFPFLVPVLTLIPDTLQTALFPLYKHWLETLQVVRDAVKEVRKEVSSDIKPTRRTVFHELIDIGSSRSSSDKLQDSLSDEVVFADALQLTGAAAETAGATIERGVYEVLSNAGVYKKLTQELRDAFPSLEAMNMAALEKLPYLGGVVREALRLHPGIPGRLPRVVPLGGLALNQTTLPPGTVVSMSAYTIHQNATVFPDPQLFDPTRWTGPEEEVRLRERYLVSFSKGTRNCVGETLAMFKVYCCLAALFYRFDDLKVAPRFERSHLDMVELFIGYHPKKAMKFAFLRNEDLEGQVE